MIFFTKLQIAYTPVINVFYKAINDLKVFVQLQISQLQFAVWLCATETEISAALRAFKFTEHSKS